MVTIGHVVRLQVQRSSLKTGEKPHRVYDPAPLLSVERLAVTPQGTLGQGLDHAWVIDVHHQAHPATKNTDGQHGVSLGFTTHYRAMQDRFGHQVSFGSAGENILVETERMLAFDDLRAGASLVSPEGRERVQLAVLEVAHPCRPFTGWALGCVVEKAVLKTHLQFLDDGMRGFYCLALGTGIVALGDRLVVS